MTTPFWFNDPTILFKNKYILQLWPLETMNAEQKLNAISRLIILLTIIGYLLTQTLKLLITGIITLVVIVLLYKIQNEKSKSKPLSPTEAFSNLNLYNAIKNNHTLPSEINPAMNILLPEIQDDPSRPEAAPAYNKEIEKKMNDDTKKFVGKQFNDPNIDSKLFNDLGDNFNFDQSMRSWYATANTTIPNDQKSFAEFCYGDMVSCKEGNEFACTRNNHRWKN